MLETQWTLESLVQEVIKRGKESLRKAGHRPICIEGGLEGFDLCATIEPTLKAYEDVLRERGKREDELQRKLRTDQVSIDNYWRYRYGTLQVEYVYQILRVAYQASPQSARAVMAYAAIVGVAEKPAYQRRKITGPTEF